MPAAFRILNGIPPTRELLQLPHQSASAGEKIFTQTVNNVTVTYPSLSASSFTHESGAKWSIIHGPLTMTAGLQAPLYNPRLILKLASKESETVSFTFEVNLYPFITGQLPTDTERFSSLVASLIPSSGYRLCTGLPQDVDKADKIERKSVRKWGLPLNRIDHKDCALWFYCESRDGLSRCSKCTRLLYYVRKQIKKRAMMTPEQKRRHIMPSSRCPYRALSPDSVRKRLKKVCEEKTSLQKKVQS